MVAHAQTLPRTTQGEAHWSPEQICGRLISHSLSVIRLCAETIYLQSLCGTAHWKMEWRTTSCFCDRNTPWQKGTIENTNKRIRQHLSCITDLTQAI